MNLKEENIKNLTSMWELAGIKSEALVMRDSFNGVIIPGSQWPNRIWIKNQLNNEEACIAADFMASETIPTTLSVFCNQQSQNLMQATGFEKTSEQVGMHLKLHNSFPENNLRFERVNEKESAELWSLLFTESFGYQIPHELVLSLSEDVEFFLLFLGLHPIGTAMLYSTNSELVGIHSLGIIPEFRRQGFAEKAMHKLLNMALHRNYNYAVLQASQAAIGLYQSLDFRADFIMENYHLSNYKINRHAIH